MSETFTIPQEIMPSTLAAYAKGKKDFDAFANVAITMFQGVTAIQFKAAFESVRAEAARAGDFATLASDAKGYTVPAKLKKIVLSGQDFVKKHSIPEKKKGDKVVTPAFTPKIQFLLEIDGDNVTLAVVQGRIGKRSANGTVGANSRISAFVAWERGKKKGDTFKVVKVKDSEGKVKGYKVDGRPVASRGKGGLATYILKMHPKSHTTAILVNYGYSLD